MPNRAPAYFACMAAFKPTEHKQLLAALNRSKIDRKVIAKEINDVVANVGVLAPGLLPALDEITKNIRDNSVEPSVKPKRPNTLTPIIPAESSPRDKIQKSFEDNYAKINEDLMSRLAFHHEKFNDGDKKSYFHGKANVKRLNAARKQENMTMASADPVLANRINVLSAGSNSSVAKFFEKHNFKKNKQDIFSPTKVMKMQDLHNHLLNLGWSHSGVLPRRGPAGGGGTGAHVFSHPKHNMLMVRVKQGDKDVKDAKHYPKRDA